MHACVFEIKSIIEDPRNMKPGGVFTAIQIWEMSVIPALLFSSECWFQLKQKDLQRLNKLEETFYHVILKTPRTCPKVALYWFTGGLSMKFKIMIRKLAFLHHVFHLSEDDLAKEVLEEERRLEIPGLWSSSLEDMKQMNVPISDLTQMNKIQWKSCVREAV